MLKTKQMNSVKERISMLERKLNELDVRLRIENGKFIRDNNYYKCESLEKELYDLRLQRHNLQYEIDELVNDIRAHPDFEVIV